jgi:hypothetical protein
VRSPVRGTCWTRKGWHPQCSCNWMAQPAVVNMSAAVPATAYMYSGCAAERCMLCQPCLCAFGGLVWGIHSVLHACTSSLYSVWQAQLWPLAAETQSHRVTLCQRVLAAIVFLWPIARCYGSMMLRWYYDDATPMHMPCKLQPTTNNARKQTNKEANQPSTTA